MNNKKTETLTQVLIKENLLTEIKRLQTPGLLFKVENDEEGLVWIHTKYWTWYPFHFRNCPNADTNDLFLAQADFPSSDIWELKIAIELLEKVVFFVEEYKLTTFAELVSLVKQKDE